MAKLYAELSSDKGGRIIGKGGNEYVNLTIRDGKNHIIANVEYNHENHQLHVNDETGNLSVNLDGYIVN